MCSIMPYIMPLSIPVDIKVLLSFLVLIIWTAVMVLMVIGTDLVIRWKSKYQQSRSQQSPVQLKVKPMNAFMEATDYRVWFNYQMKSKLPCDRGHDEWIFTQTSGKWHTIGVLIFKKILKIANQNP